MELLKLVQFKDGLLDGPGEEHYVGNEKFVGIFLDGIRHGDGTLTTELGGGEYSTLTGEWLCDENVLNAVYRINEKVHFTFSGELNIYRKIGNGKGIIPPSLVENYNGDVSIDFSSAT